MVFDEAGGFPTDVRLGEDFLLWLRIALTHKAVLLYRPLANYNQDVAVAFRGTHHLHPPEKNMLWHLDEWSTLETENADYKQLVDNLRTYSLMNYLLDRRYHTAARKELAKVDWSRQPKSITHLYNRPLWYLILRRYILTKGSYIKQWIAHRFQ